MKNHDEKPLQDAIDSIWAVQTTLELAIKDKDCNKAMYEMLNRELDRAFLCIQEVMDSDVPPSPSPVYNAASAGCAPAE